MSRTLRVLSLALLVSAALMGRAHAQGYTEDFDGAAAPTNWTLTAPVGGVGWAFDNSPVAMPGGSTFGASLRSLNYNDGVDFDNGFANTGNATSPTLVVTGSPVTVSWQCNWSSEASSSFDQRFLEVINPGPGTVMAGGTFQVFDGAVGALDCALSGTFHAHTIDITSVLGTATSFRVRFRFNSVDAAGNTGGGWFVDSLAVVGACIDTTPPTIPTLLTPADGGIVSSPPAVTLIWSDSTDTSTCGPGVVAGYVVELDDTTPPVLPYVFSATPAVATVSAGVLAPGTYYWRVRAVDLAGNVSADSAIFSFTAEAPAAPLAPDGLFVNESGDGAQAGDPGFVDPVTDQQPEFSAVYRDGNTSDSANVLRYQVSLDPTFTVVLSDSGDVGFSPSIAKDGRCQDLACPIVLDRNTVYYWRIRFTDVGGLAGPFSTPQSFRIGDDFEFGVRHGSSHHGRRCYVATAAFGGVSAEVEGLASFRQGVVERSGAGRVFSRWYATTGAPISSLVTSGQGIRGLSIPAAHPMATAALAGLLALAIAGAALRRL